MNEAQRKVLRHNYGDIMKNLVLDTDILGLLLQKDVLTETMVHHIQSKSTQHEKISELLFLLPKRGPKAFPVFLEAVKKHSSFLADKLEEGAEKEQKIIMQQIKEQIELANGQKPASSGFQDDITGTGSPRSGKPPEPASERTPHKSSESFHSSNLPISSTNHVMTSNVIQQNLNTLYTKLKAKLETHVMRENSFSTPEPATFKMVDKLVDELFENLEENETKISQCYAMLGGKDRNYPLVSHIINLQKSKREFELELKQKEQQKNKYADHISKLENRCRNQTTEIGHLNEEVRKLREEVAKLEEINSEREEKQKIIDDLRKMVMDADNSKRNKLRSSYLALHYDSNASEIKQLKAEVKSLKSENESLKTENLMLMKSENLKKLAKLREDHANQKHKDEHANNKPREEHMIVKQDSGNGHWNHVNQTNYVHEDALESPKSKHRSMFSFPTHQSRGSDRSTGFFYSQTTETVRTSTENIRASNEHLAYSDTEDTVRTAVAKQKDRDYHELDFNFQHSQNGLYGQKRSPSKDRANKRVTFSDDETNIREIRDDVVKIPTAPYDVEQERHNVTENEHIRNSKNMSRGQNPGKSEKGEKVSTTRGRSAKQGTKTKGSKRSASLNNMNSGRDLVKMSTQLIQKSRKMRQPISHW